MKNQRSWRTLSEIESNDTILKVSKVIGKVDSNGDSFYPDFSTPTTVVLMSDDKKTFETCKATADGAGNMTLTKRGLSDDQSETEVANFKLDRLPGTYMFATMAAGDLVSLNDNNTWNGDQTRVGDQTFSGNLSVAGTLNVIGNIDMATAGDVGISTTTGTVTFQDKDVGPVTLAQMIHPAGAGTEVLIMDETTYQGLTPTVNTVYGTYDDSNTKQIMRFHLNGTDYPIGDVQYSDFAWSTVSGATITINKPSMTTTPSADFTVACGTVKEGMQYILRITSGATAYEMTLGTGITNPFNEDLTLTANKTTTICFLATSSSTLELFVIRTPE